VAVTQAVSWTVIDDSGEPIAPTEADLVHLTALEDSTETVRGAHELAERVQARSGVSFFWHVFGHRVASSMIGNHVPVEMVDKLLTQRSSATTSATYVRLDPADLRGAVRKAGIWDERDVPDGPGCS
jgi:hypothetical protein